MSGPLFWPTRVLLKLISRSPGLGITLFMLGAVTKAEVLRAGPEELPRVEVLLTEVLLLWPGLLNGGST